MADNDGAVLLERDELNALIESFGKFAGSGGDEIAAFCQAWNGASWDVSRLTRDGRLVQRACLNLLGGITRGSLSKHFGRLTPSGFMARMLLAWPPMLEPRRWDDDRPEPEGADEYERTWLGLHELRTSALAQSPEPTTLTLTDEARTLWADAQLQFKREHAEAHDEPLQAMLGKLDAQLARVAGVIHLVRVASDDGTQDHHLIDADTMRSAVAILSWFEAEAQRCHKLLSEDDRTRSLRELAQRIERAGGRMTPAELRRAMRGITTSEAAKSALRELAEAGWGVITHPPPGRAGGRPRDLEFQLYPKRETGTSLRQIKVSETRPAA